MDFNERIKQIRELYINHPLERINKFKDVMDNTNALQKDIRNAKNGIIIARNNYNIQSFDFHISWLKQYLVGNISFDALKEQFGTISGLLNDMCENMNEFNEAIYDALMNEIDVFDNMLKQIEKTNNNQINNSIYDKSYEESLKDTDNFIKETKKEYTKKPNILYVSLLRYCRNLNLLAKFLSNIEKNIDVYNNIDYNSVELQEKINKIVYNEDAINVLKGVVEEDIFKRIESQNKFVNERINEFNEHFVSAKNASLKDVSMLILKDKAAIRELIKIINDSIPLEKESDVELKQNEVQVDVIETKEFTQLEPKDSIALYDELMHRKQILNDHLNTISNEEIELKRRHDELEYTMGVKKNSGGRITMQEAIEECTLRMKGTNYKQKEKDLIKNEQIEIKERLNNHKFDISDILRRVRFNSFGYFRRILFGKNAKLSRYEKYVSKKKNKQKIK